VIDRLVDALDAVPGAIPVLPVVDSLCHAESDPRGVMMGAPARVKPCAGCRPRRPFTMPTFLPRIRHGQIPPCRG
jgi:2-C-methyl-D-erythritol 4-phosphate cytidylyltransferase/2-C-methyl-D-erythritol 2,4-cyclodiphosphate synthase